MATISKVLLSESTNGKTITIDGTAAGSRDTIHTAVSGTSSIDEIWLYANNNSATASNLLTIEWGDTTANKIITVLLNPGETALVAPGLPLQNGLAVTGFCTTANYTDEINVFGYVNRIV